MDIIKKWWLVLIFGIALIFFAVNFSFAKPQGGVATYGNVIINQNPGNNISTLITQTSQKGIIDWQSFSIGTYERVHFDQPNAAAITLNRVLGGDVSNIFGKLTAIGQVFIINPSGILFGPNASVDVAGLVATTANISNADFLQGKYFFVQGPNNSAKIINQGYIKVVDGGLAALVAPSVENSGVIEANLGKVILGSNPASGTFVIDFYGDELINFTIPTDTNENTDTPITQSGTIIAHGGKVLLSVNSAKNIVDSAINMSGIIEADSVGVEAGSVVLQGGSKGVVNVTGTITVRGNQTGESGGTVKITGEKVGLFSGTMINASGEAGGGKVLVGADYQNGIVVPASSMVYVNEGATILANALGMGNGGNVIIWSNDSTWFYGTVSAKGGPEGGSGGSLETSGNWLDVYNSVVDLTAPSGEVGTWLIDPFDVYIVGGSPPPPPENGTWNGGNWTPNVSNSILYASSISSNLSSANVSINTGSSGSQAGNITVNSGANISYSGVTRSLALTAANSITMSSGSIISGNLDLNLTTTSNSGIITLNASPSVNSLSVFGPTLSSLRLNTNSIVTNDLQFYNIPILLQSNTSFSSANGTISVSNIDSFGGTFNLNITGGDTIFFYGNIGSSNPLGSLTVTGIATAQIALSASGPINIQTTQAQTYNARVVILNGNVTLVSTGGNILFGNTLGTPGGHSLVINTPQTVTFTGAVGALFPLGNLTIGGNGTAIIGGGSVTTSGAQTYNEAVILGANTSLTSQTSNISFTNSLSGGGFDLLMSALGSIFLPNGTSSVQNLTIGPVGGAVNIGGNISTTGSQTYNDNIILQNNTIFTSTGSGNIFFGNGTTIVGNAFNLTANTSGSTIFSGTIGGLQNLITDAGGNTILNLGSLSTFGSQTYNDAVLLQSDTTLMGSSVLFNNTVDSLNTTAHSLTVNTSGGVTFANTVGGTNQLLNLTTNANNTNVGGNVTTSGSQTYNNPVLLQNDATFTSTGSGDIQFTNNVSGFGFRNLMVNTSGNTIFSGALSSIQNLVTDVGGNTIIGGGNVSTFGSQSYNDAVLLQADTQFTSTIGSILFGGTLDSYNATPHTLYAVGVGGSGITFAGNVGFLHPLLFLIINPSINTFLGNIGNPINIQTTLTQSYGGPVQLFADVNINSASDSVLFSNIVIGTYNLTVSTPLNTTFSGPVGLLLNLTMNGSGSTIIQGGSVTTLGSQAYNSAVILGANTSLTSQTSNVSFTNSLSGGGFDLVVNAPGNIFLPNVISSLRNLTTGFPGGTVYIGSSGIVSTIGSQTYNDNVILQNDTVFTSTGPGNINFVGNVSSSGGPYNLTVNTSGNTIFSGGLSSLQNLTTNVGGNTIIGGNISTSGSQTYNDPVILGANTSLTSQTSNISFTNSLSGGGFDLLMSALGSIFLPNGTSSVQNLTIGPVGGAVNIGGNISTTGSQTYNDNIILQNNTIFTSTGSGNIFFGNGTTIVGNAFNLTANTSGSTIFSGTIGGLQNLITDAGGNTILNLGSLSTFGSQTYNDAVLLQSDTTLMGSSVLFNNTVDSLNTTAHSLTVNTSGGVTFANTVGGTNQLLNLTTNANNTNVGGNVTTSGSQTYNNPVLLQNDATFTSTGSGDIQFTNNVSGFGFRNLMVNTSGNTIFSGALSSIQNLVTDVGGNTIIGGGNVSTFGSQSYNDAVLLQADTQFTSTIGSILFGGTLDSYNATPHTLYAVGVGGSGITFAGNVGFLHPLLFLIINPSINTFLGNIGNPINIQTTLTQSYGGPVQLFADVNINSASDSVLFSNIVIGTYNLTVSTPLNTTFSGPVGLLLNLTMNGSGSTIIQGGSVTTLGSQAYNSAVILGANTSLTSQTSNVSFTNSLSGGGFDLVVNAPGNIFLPNVISSLRNLTTGFPGGTVYIGSSGIVSTIGSQTYNDNVILQNDTVFTSTGPGNINFVGNVSSSGGPYNLTVNTSGNTIFSGVLSSIQNLVTDAGGNTIMGGSISTLGNQTYNDAVLLQNDTNLTSSNITFNSTVDSNTTARNLTVNTSSNTSFNGTIGSTNPLLNLNTSTSGSTILNGGTVITQGAQTYNNPLYLGVDTVLNSTGGGIISFTSLVNSNNATARNLTINTASDINLLGAVGTINPLLNLISNAGGNTVIGNNINTLGNQTYNGGVLVTGNAFLNAAGDIFFANTINGPGNLAITTPGNLTFLGSIGTSNPLASLSIAATNIPITDVSTSGAQVYNGVLVLNANTNLVGGTIAFNNAITGSFGLTLASSGDIIFNGLVGSFNAPLTNLQILNANNVTASAQIFTNSFTQSAGNGTTNFAVLLFSGTGGIGSYIPGSGNGPITIVTNNAMGIIDAASLSLATQTANLTGYLSGNAAPEGISNIVILNPILPNAIFWGQIDLFTPANSDIAAQITNTSVNQVIKDSQQETEPTQQSITCVDYNAEILTFGAKENTDYLYLMGPFVDCK